jgi:hypothetical protein
MNHRFRINSKIHFHRLPYSILSYITTYKWGMFRRWRNGTERLNVVVSGFWLQCSRHAAVDLKRRFASRSTFTSCFTVCSCLFLFSIWSALSICCLHRDNRRATNNWSCSLKQDKQHKGYIIKVNEVISNHNHVCNISPLLAIFFKLPRSLVAVTCIHQTILLEGSLSNR